MTSDVKFELVRILRDTPAQMLEIQQHVAPTHMRGREDGSSHRKPSSRPPMNLDAFDAVRAEEQQVKRWSAWLGVQRGSVGQRLSVLRACVDDLSAVEAEMILSAWLPTRAHSRKRYPTEEDKDYISVREAMAITSRSRRTLQIWAKEFPSLQRPNGRDDREVQYRSGVLRAVEAEMKRRAAERGKQIRNGNVQVAA